MCVSVTFSDEKMLACLNISPILFYTAHNLRRFYMKRMLMEDLVIWKDKVHRKPLILWGARQVGKTWLIAITGQYEGDFSKHVAQGDLPRIRMVWEALPVQLAKENRKFFYGQVKKGARLKDFEKAIEWMKNIPLWCINAI